MKTEQTSENIFTHIKIHKTQSYDKYLSKKASLNIFVHDVINLLDYEH